MKFLMMIVIAVSTMFIIQVVDLEAAMLPNEIKILKNDVKYGSEFGDGWTEEQKKVWSKTQEWWQILLSSDWSKLAKSYHKDAILYPHYQKVPIYPSAFEAILEERAPAHDIGRGFGYVYCTVHDIRIIENIAIVMLSMDFSEMYPATGRIFVWMKQGASWELISTISK